MSSAPHSAAGACAVGLGNCVVERYPKSYDQEIKSLPDGAGSRPGFIFKGTSVVSLPRGEGSCLGGCSQLLKQLPPLGELRAAGKLALEARECANVPPQESQGHPGTHCLVSVFIACSHQTQLLVSLPLQRVAQPGVRGYLGSWACMLVSWVTADPSLILSDYGLAGAFSGMVGSDG